jgi:hypothetical protein
MEKLARERELNCFPSVLIAWNFIEDTGYFPDIRYRPTPYPFQTLKGTVLFILGLHSEKWNREAVPKWWHETCLLFYIDCSKEASPCRSKNIIKINYFFFLPLCMIFFPKIIWLE